ncbi:MAG: DUF86 domain-containing protein [Lachnospiraceae bacterium]|nr:DUF86 domain-containing protein [Candidatus Minthocola equi]
MGERDRAILLRIKKYCEDIGIFIDRFGENYDVFTTDRAYFNAVSMCVFQIGELSGKLSEDYRDETSDQIPWQDIKGMRNIVAHDYGSIDEELLWETVIEDIPALRRFCTAQLDSFR